MSVVAFLLVLAWAAPPPVHYDVSFDNAVHHEARIAVRYQGLDSGPLHIRVSRASPGRYALHEFAKNIYDVQARDGRGRALQLVHPDPDGWDVAGHDGSVTFTYTLYADYANGTYSGIDLSHAHLNMPATFVWARGMEDRPISVTFRPPGGSGWKVATQLAPTDDSLTFSAPNLDYFMDSPTELSDFALREWQVTDDRGAYTMRVAMHYQGSDAALDDYAAWARKLVEEARGVFGEYPRFDFGTYTFIADYLPWVYGDGMEHRNSTILTSSLSLDGSGVALLGTVSHEFFHAWNVERIRPRSLEPFDFERANMSGELWLAEGFTSYYGNLLMRRAALIDDDGLARRLSDAVSTIMRSPGRLYYSPIGMSMQAPFVDRASHIDVTNQENTFISYYTWGSALALALDLTLRTRFAGLDLDGYMRALWRQFGDPQLPYTIDDLQRTLGEYTADPDFAAAFFHDFIYGRQAPDFKGLLAQAGFAVVKAHPGQATFGWAELDYGARGAALRSPTIVGSPLYKAGLDRGDLILRIDGRALRSGGDLQALTAGHRPGDEVTIEFQQRGKVREASLRLAENDWMRVVPYEAAGLPVTAGMETLRGAWLGTKAE